MDNISDLLGGFADVITPMNLLFALLGVIVGTAVGVLPGIGPAMTVARPTDVVSSRWKVPDRRSATTTVAERTRLNSANITSMPGEDWRNALALAGAAPAGRNSVDSGGLCQAPAAFAASESSAAVRAAESANGISFASRSTRTRATTPSQMVSEPIRSISAVSALHPNSAG